MQPKLYPVLVIYAALFFSCGKNSSTIPEITKPNTKIKIEVISGDNQTDTIGNFLKDSVSVKVTKDGQPLKGYFVQFTGSGCDNDLMEEQATNSFGIVNHSWKLSAVTGKQTLKIVVLDDKRSKLDSTAATTNTIKPTHGWLYSACLPPNANGGRLAKLTSGRLLNILSDSHIYYSDDNAITWHQLKSNLNIKTCRDLISNKHDDLFLAADGDLLYSKDQGKTWEKRNAVHQTHSAVDAFLYSDNEKLVISYLSADPGTPCVWISADKGLNWTPVVAGFPGGTYIDMAEQRNGDIFLLEAGGALIDLTDNNTNWHTVVASSSPRVLGVACDNSGVTYISQLEDDRYGSNKISLYKSLNAGQAFTKFNTGYSTYFYLRLQGDGNIYMWGVSEGIFMLNTNNNLVNNLTPASPYTGPIFILAKNNSLVFWNVKRTSHLQDISNMAYTLP